MATARKEMLRSLRARGHDAMDEAIEKKMTATEIADVQIENLRAALASGGIALTGDMIRLIADEAYALADALSDRAAALDEKHGAVGARGAAPPSTCPACKGPLQGDGAPEPMVIVHKRCWKEGDACPG